MAGNYNVKAQTIGEKQQSSCDMALMLNLSPIAETSKSLGQICCSVHIFPVLVDISFTPNDLYPAVSTFDQFRPYSIQC
jgi:hypothetical protein